VNDGEASVSTSKIITVLNQAPVANAGPDQTVVRRSIVTLDGSASFDQDIGDNIRYQWTQLSGRTVTLSNPNSAITTFEAPGVRRDTTRELVFELTVTDEEGVTSSDTVLITVTR
jgi:chitinase